MPEYNAQNFYQASDTEFELVLIRLAQLGVELNLDRGEVLRVLEESANTLQKTIQHLKQEHEAQKKKTLPFKRPPINTLNGKREIDYPMIDLSPTFPDTRELSEGDRQWL